MRVEPRTGALASALRDEGFQALIITLFFAVGVAGHHYLPRAMLLMTPGVLWMFGFLVVILSLRTAILARNAPGKGPDRAARVRGIVWMAVTYVLTFIIEAVGTATGTIFGPYDYGTVIGLSLFSVPLVIGFNWVIVVLGAQRALQPLPGWLAVPGSAAITVAFDWLLEPVAVRLGYWSWHRDDIPLQNYLAWFIIAAFTGFLFRASGIRLVSRLPLFYLIIQAVFFLALRAVV